MCAPAGALPPFEVAVAGRRASLAGRQDVRVHAQAHRTPGVAPLETGGLEDRVEALILRGTLDRRGPRHHHRAYLRMHVLARDHLRRGAKVFETGIRARADEDPID